MKSIHFENYAGPRLSREAQLRRLHRVIQGELTPLQRDVVCAYYFQRRTMSQIAADRGVNKSTVCRTLQRAEARLKRCLKY